MSSKINSKFWAAIEKSDLSLVRKVFSQHSSYLCKINSPIALLNAFLRLQLYGLAFRFYARPEVFKKKLTSKDYIAFRCYEAVFFSSHDCYLRAHAILDEVSKENLDEKDKRLLIVFRGEIYLAQEDFKKALDCYDEYLRNGQESFKSFSFFYNYIVCLIHLNRFTDIASCFTKLESLAKDELKKKTYVVLKAFYELTASAADSDVIEKQLVELLSLVDHGNQKSQIYHLLGMIAQRMDRKNDAIQSYLNACDLEGFPPRTAVLDNYKPLLELGYPLSLEQKVSLYCYPNRKEGSKNCVYQIFENDVQEVSYAPRSLVNNYVDLVSGRICLSGEIQWLTKLQTKFILSLVSAGDIGLHISNLESFVFSGDAKTRSNSYKHIEVLLVYMKRLGFQFSRKDNYIYFHYNSSLKYIVPSNLNYQGPMAILEHYQFFGRVDLENILLVKKSVASEMIKKWVDEGRVLKRPDVGANAYSVKEKPVLKASE